MQGGSREDQLLVSPGVLAVLRAGEGHAGETVEEVGLDGLSDGGGGEGAVFEKAGGLG